MKVLEYQDIIQLHIDKFGVEPVITGINYAISGDIEDLILEAIAAEVPYVEQEVPEGVSTQGLAMPKKLEMELRKEAKKKRLGEERTNAYVYGTLRKTGWIPSTQKKKSK